MIAALVRRVLWAVATVAFLAGCGISTEDAPRDIDAPVRPDSGENGRTAITATATTLIYLVGHDDDGRFVLRPIARDTTETITNALQSLFEGPTQRELNADLRSAIPSTARLLKAVPNNDVVIIDVSDALIHLSGAALIDAVGQIVLTATNVTGVTGVVITVGDVAHPWPLPDGSTTVDPLTRRDYESLLPDHRVPATDPTVAPTLDTVATTTTVPPTTIPETTPPATTIAVPDTPPPTPPATEPENVVGPAPAPA
jgi:hypothetical protein